MTVKLHDQGSGHGILQFHGRVGQLEALACIPPEVDVSLQIHGDAQKIEVCYVTTKVAGPHHMAVCIKFSHKSIYGASDAQPIQGQIVQSQFRRRERSAHIELALRIHGRGEDLCIQGTAPIEAPHTVRRGQYRVAGVRCSPRASRVGGCDGEGVSRAVGEPCHRDGAGSARGRDACGQAIDVGGDGVAGDGQAAVKAWGGETHNRLRRATHSGHTGGRVGNVRNHKPLRDGAGRQVGRIAWLVGCD